MQTLFIEARSDQDLIPAIRANLSTLKKLGSIGLFTTVQHINQLEKAKDFLEKNNIKILTGKSKKSAGSQGPCAFYKGQVLGCDASAAKNLNVDSYVYVGTGEFHPIAIALETEKPVFKLNPLTKILEQISQQDKKKWLARKAARLDKLNHSKKIGIILSTKPGQYKPKLADKLRKKFKNSYVFISDTLTASDLLNFPDIDCWINTACPRLVDDRWHKTFVNANDIV
jgi:2-(3-amino-3-carboxypropyl)histidine synthase